MLPPPFPPQQNYPPNGYFAQIIQRLMSGGQQAGPQLPHFPPSPGPQEFIQGGMVGHPTPQIAGLGLRPPGGQPPYGQQQQQPYDDGFTPGIQGAANPPVQNVMSQAVQAARAKAINDFEHTAGGPNAAPGVTGNGQFGGQLPSAPNAGQANPFAALYGGGQATGNGQFGGHIAAAAPHAQYGAPVSHSAPMASVPGQPFGQHQLGLGVHPQASNVQMLNQIGRARQVAQALQHLRKLRPVG